MADVNFKIGDRVRHKDFGEGVIISLTGAGRRDCQALVEFDKTDPILHSGNNVTDVVGKAKSCWWCLPRGLELLEDLGFLT